MKNLFIFIFLILSSLASATTYYIAPNGSDSNSGTLSSPFFTLNKAWSVIQAGDIIYARGGTYRFSSRQSLTGKNGTSSDTIKVWAYPGERPVFTKSSTYTTPGWPASLIYLDADYTYWKSIEIAYYTQQTSAIWYGMAALGSNHNKFERINSHHNGHGMVIRDESSYNLVLNCDFHHNYDPLTSGDAYGNADGLEVGYQSGSVENTIRGCRLWENSDDGIDLWANNGNVIIENCWAWKNGFREDGITPGGDGGGLKFGATTTADGSEFKRTVKNCMSVYNRNIGFNQNGADVKFYFYNNIAYNNPQGIVFYSFDLPNIVRNNVSFGNSSENWNGPHANTVRDHNSYDAGWQPAGPVASASDYISVDTTGISRARQSDGSLPNISFLRLAPGSDLIDAGVNVGISYGGNAPDLGPFETQAATVSPTLTYVSSVVENNTPSVVGITYNLTLASILPSTSCFSIQVNSVARTINTLAITGNKVLINLASPVVYGDVITVAYTKPATNPLQCVAATQAATISAMPVTNAVNSVTPVYVSSVIENSTPDKVEMTYNVSLANTVPTGSAFLAKVNGTNRSVNSVMVSGNKVILTLQSNVVHNDIVTIAYTKPVTNPLQTISGATAETISSQPVINNIQGITTNSTDTAKYKKNISIYPNPAREFINISNLEPSSEPQIIRVFDFSGKLCMEARLNTVNNNKIPINLKSGMYIVQIVIGPVIKFAQRLVVI